jgi:hypothetical protein
VRLGGLSLAAYVMSKIAVLARVLAAVATILIAVLQTLDRLPARSRAPCSSLFATLTVESLGALALGLLVSAAVKDAAQATLALPMLCFPQVLFAGAVASCETLGQRCPGRLSALRRWTRGATGRRGNRSLQVELRLTHRSRRARSAGGSCAPRVISDHADVLCFLALLARCHVELDALAFVKALVALALDVGEMNEDVITLLARDEAESFFCVEELHCPLCHEYSFLIAAGQPVRPARSQRLYSRVSKTPQLAQLSSPRARRAACGCRKLVGLSNASCAPRSHRQSGPLARASTARTERSEFSRGGRVGALTSVQLAVNHCLATVGGDLGGGQIHPVGRSLRRLT